MAFEGVSAAGGDGFFPQHPKSGDWETLKGRMLSPHELMADMNPANEGDPRFNGEVSPYNWEDTVVTGGEYDPNKLTHGTDKHMLR